MKKSYWVLLVLLLGFAGDRIGGFLLSSVIWKSQFRYSKLYRGEASCDLLFAGNSRGLMFYQPYLEEKTGRTTCNLSYNGMPVTLASALVKDFIDINGAPKLLMLDITMIDQRMDERLITGFNCYSPWSERLTSLLKFNFPNDYFTSKISHLYRCNSEVFQRALYYLNKSDKDWLLDRVISPALQNGVMKQPAFSFDFTPNMLREFADMVQYAKSKGARVELVVNPYYPPFAARISNLDALIQAVEETTGLNVHDYSGAVTNVEGFGDYQHLNKEGAKEFLDRLFADKIIPFAHTSLGQL